MDFFKPLQAALNINRPAAMFIAGGYILVALAIVLVGQFGNVGLNPLLLAVYLLIFSVLVLVLARLPGAARILMAWLLVLLFSLWLIAVLIQVMTQNGVTPPLAIARCLLNPLQPVCEQITLSADTPSDPQPTTSTETASTTVALPRVVEPGPPADAARARSTVFVQFAGFPRETVVAMSQALVALGWPVQGADRGGERLGAAAGLHQVRFFHPDDEALATALAAEVSASLPGAPPIEVKDFSDTAVAARARPGTLEVWVSP